MMPMLCPGCLYSGQPHFENCGRTKIVVVESITRFEGKYDFLSNFHPSRVTLDGEEYRTVEHAFQAAKTLDVDERRNIQKLPTPGQAKKLGRMVALREDWEGIKDAVMLELVRKKFDWAGPRLLLEMTGDAELVEGNWWGDKYWGVYNGEGQNKLGKILMRVREENRK